MDIDVYDDIADFDLGDEIEKLKNENRLLEDHVKSLESDIEKLTATIVKLKQNQDNLTKNISSLYLTAKAEIERKDRMIVELRTDLDNIYFRRRKVPNEVKRKETEEVMPEINVHKRLKLDNQEDRPHSRSSADSCSVRGTGSRSGSRERNERHKAESESREPTNRESRNQFPEKCDEYRDDREEMEIRDTSSKHRDYRKRYEERFGRDSRGSRERTDRYEERRGSRERFDQYDDEWGNRDRFCSYRDDRRNNSRGRYSDRNRMGHDGYRKSSDRENRFDDRYDAEKQVEDYFNFNAVYGRDVRPIERHNYGGRDLPPSRSRERSNEADEKFERSRTPQDRHDGRERTQRPDRRERTGSNSNIDEKCRGNHVENEISEHEKRLSTNLITGSDDGSRNKPVKKKLKMLQAMEEKMKRKRSSLGNQNAKDQSHKADVVDLTDFAKDDNGMSEKKRIVGATSKSGQKTRDSPRIPKKMSSNLSEENIKSVIDLTEPQHKCNDRRDKEEDSEPVRRQTKHGTPAKQAKTCEDLEIMTRKPEERDKETLERKLLEFKRSLRGGEESKEETDEDKNGCNKEDKVEESVEDKRQRKSSRVNRQSDLDSGNSGKVGEPQKAKESAKENSKMTPVSRSDKKIVGNTNDKEVLSSSVADKDKENAKKDGTIVSDSSAKILKETSKKKGKENPKSKTEDLQKEVQSEEPKKSAQQEAPDVNPEVNLQIPPTDPQIEKSETNDENVDPKVCESTANQMDGGAKRNSREKLESTTCESGADATICTADKSEKNSIGSVSSENKDEAVKKCDETAKDAPITPVEDVQREIEGDGGSASKSSAKPDEQSSEETLEKNKRNDETKEKLSNKADTTHKRIASKKVTGGSKKNNVTAESREKPITKLSAEYNSHSDRAKLDETKTEEAPDSVDDKDGTMRGKKKEKEVTKGLNNVIAENQEKPIAKLSAKDIPHSDRAKVDEARTEEAPALVDDKDGTIKGKNKEKEVRKGSKNVTAENQERPIAKLSAEDNPHSDGEKLDETKTEEAPASVGGKDAKVEGKQKEKGDTKGLKNVTAENQEKPIAKLSAEDNPHSDGEKLVEIKTEEAPASVGGKDGKVEGKQKEKGDTKGLKNVTADNQEKPDAKLSAKDIPHSDRAKVDEAKTEEAPASVNDKDGTVKGKNKEKEVTKGLKNVTAENQEKPIAKLSAGDNPHSDGAKLDETKTEEAPASVDDKDGNVEGKMKKKGVTKGSKNVIAENQEKPIAKLSAEDNPHSDGAKLVETKTKEAPALVGGKDGKVEGKQKEKGDAKGSKSLNSETNSKGENPKKYQECFNKINAIKDLPLEHKNDDKTGEDKKNEDVIIDVKACETTAENVTKEAESRSDTRKCFISLDIVDLEKLKLSVKEKLEKKPLGLEKDEKVEPNGEDRAGSFQDSEINDEKMEEKADSAKEEDKKCPINAVNELEKSKETIEEEKLTDRLQGFINIGSKNKILALKRGEKDDVKAERKNEVEELKTGTKRVNKRKRSSNSGGEQQKTKEPNLENIEKSQKEMRAENKYFEECGETIKRLEKMENEQESKSENCEPVTKNPVREKISKQTTRKSPSSLRREKLHEEDPSAPCKDDKKRKQPVRATKQTPKDAGKMQTAKSVEPQKGDVSNKNLKRDSKNCDRKDNETAKDREMEETSQEAPSDVCANMEFHSEEQREYFTRRSRESRNTKRETMELKVIKYDNTETDTRRGVTSIFDVDRDKSKATRPIEEPPECPAAVGDRVSSEVGLDESSDSSASDKKPPKPDNMASVYKKLDSLIEMCLEEADDAPKCTSTRDSNVTADNLRTATLDKAVARRRITPTPVKDDPPICSFENILGKNARFSGDAPAAVTPLHLTHEGEIPVLHLEENHIDQLPTESNNDKNILKLLDTMSISNMEGDSKFKSIAAEASLSPIRGDGLTFESIVTKATSTPIAPQNRCGTEEGAAKGEKRFSEGGIAVASTASDKEGNVSRPSVTLPLRRRRRCRLIIKD